MKDTKRGHTAKTSTKYSKNECFLVKFESSLFRQD